MERRTKLTGLGIEIPEVLLPDKKVNMRKWAVIACDQFTSNRAYWGEVERIVGNNPSTLHIMLPEIYLDAPDKDERIRAAKNIMANYIDDGILSLLPAGFVLVERQTDGGIRKGLMVNVDLEAFEPEPSAKSTVRASEEILHERVMPRVDIRAGAELEMPHIFLLMDDPDFKVIEPIWRRREDLAKLYDFDLMLNGGRTAGYLVNDKEMEESILHAMSELKTRGGMRFCVGDGNHSLATAKEVWEEAKRFLPADELETSPLRYAMCELINLHDPALSLKPIHRVIKGATPAMAIQYVVDRLNSLGADARLVFSRRKPSMQMTDAPQVVFFSSKDSSGRIEINAPNTTILADLIQPVLERFASEHSSCELDYIHGDEEFERITGGYDALGFLMPPMRKETFFDELSEYGVFPKKCFSLGEAHEKRYYLECRLLTNEVGEVEEEMPVTDTSMLEQWEPFADEPYDEEGTARMMGSTMFDLKVETLGEDE